VAAVAAVALDVRGARAFKSEGRDWDKRPPRRAAADAWRARWTNIWKPAAARAQEAKGRVRMLCGLAAD
jgi:hypothetical protein